MLFEKNLEKRTSSESDQGVIKKWYDEENHLYIKASSYEKRTKTYHIEAIMECLASKIGKLIGFPVVEYRLDDLTEKNGKITKVCVSHDYKFELDIQEVITAVTYLSRFEDEIKNRTDRYRILVENEPQIKADLDKMILFDYLINNDDRHLRNFELYTLTDDSVHLSPFFDNGYSLLADWADDDLEDLRDNDDLFEEHIVLAQTRSKCFTMNHSTALHLVSKDSFQGINLDITDEQFKEIVNEFKNLLSPIRLEMICELLKYRYNNIKKHYQRLK